LAVDVVVLAEQSGCIVFHPDRTAMAASPAGIIFVSSVFSFGFGKQQSFRFMAGFFTSWFLYAFLQDSSVALAPAKLFYLNYGLVKEKMIATKSAHVLWYVAKMVTYAAFGALTTPYLGMVWLL